MHWVTPLESTNGSKRYDAHFPVGWGVLVICKSRSTQTVKGSVCKTVIHGFDSRLRV